jgi:hypothetical protein
MKHARTGVILAPIFFLIVGWLLLQMLPSNNENTNRPSETIGESVRSWLPRRRVDLATLQRETCPNAPFLVPTSGYIGLYYNDPSRPYSQTRRHQVVDIFSVGQPLGTQPVYAVYDGYISHRWDWQSAVIQRIPSDPLNPSQQIWVYYTHMADEQGNDFIEPAFDYGATEVFVTMGTLLGYVGNYDGNVPSRIHPHLHLSIVKDDGRGTYLNELEIANTLDPSPYFGVAVGYGSAETASLCGSTTRIDFDHQRFMMILFTKLSKTLKLTEIQKIVATS